MRLLSVSPKLIRRLNVCHSRKGGVVLRSLAFIQTASAALLRSIHRRRLARRLVSFAIILNLLIWPAPGITLKSFEPASALASTVSSTVIAEASLAFCELREAPVVFVPLGPILLPLPVFPLWPFQSSRVAGDLTIAERTARVASISVSPQKCVGYIGDSVTFVAMGSDSEGQPAHGAKFTWESSNEDKLILGADAQTFADYRDYFFSRIPLGPGDEFWAHRFFFELGYVWAAKSYNTFNRTTLSPTPARDDTIWKVCFTIHTESQDNAGDTPPSKSD